MSIRIDNTALIAGTVHSTPLSIDCCCRVVYVHECWCRDKRTRAEVGKVNVLEEIKLEIKKKQNCAKRITTILSLSSLFHCRFFSFPIFCLLSR